MLIKFFRSFVYAFNGMRLGLEERNMRIHLIATLVVLFLGWYFKITETEWLVVFLCIGMVISAELFNTALEKICDAVAPLHSDLRPHLGKPKDLSAGAVLVISSAAGIIGIIIFLPHLLTWMYSL